MKLFSRQFNLGENLPRTITFNTSKRNIELAQRKQESKRISNKNSGKFPERKVSPENTSPRNFPPHGKLSPWKIPRSENFPFPTQKMYAYFPIKNTICKHWANFIT